MKAVIGDIHGRDFWKKALEDGNFTDIYCTGDYWDTHDDTPYTVQKKNFIEIIEAAKTDRRLHLCIGNHDLHYIAEGEMYSSYQWEYHSSIGRLIIDALPYLRVAYEADGWLISHAGFSKTFMKNAGCTNIEDVQKRFDANFCFLGFARSGQDIYGNDPEQGPLWIRPPALFRDMFAQKQIVGHTPVERITEYASKDGKRLILVDADGTGEAFVF